MAYRVGQKKRRSSTAEPLSVKESLCFDGTSLFCFRRGLIAPSAMSNLPGCPSPLTGGGMHKGKFHAITGKRGKTRDRHRILELVLFERDYFLILFGSVIK